MSKPANCRCFIQPVDCGDDRFHPIDGAVIGAFARALDEDAARLADAYIEWRDPAPRSWSFTLDAVDADALALAFGYDIVEASIMFEPHLVRGTE